MPRTRLLALLLVLLPATAAAQSRAEVIRGRVTTDSGAVVAGAAVTATMAPDRLTRSTRTDAEGRYELHFP
ncbi:MAG TPA: carboxypeptidase regulatory-like domain-containing protein, partial [Longimicrobium sp.]